MTTKIGIVDDDQGTVLALTEYAVMFGYEVTSAKSGEEGIQLFQRERPDILLIDGLLPKMHGFDLCRKIKESPEGKKTPIILISGVYKGHKYRMQSSKEYKADDYFEKPVDIKKLFSRISELTGGGSEPQVAPADDHLNFKRIQEAGFPHLLHMLYEESRTGSLILEREHVRKTIYFREGYIAFALSNQKQERLGEFLLADKVISPGQYSRISQAMKATGKRFGMLLLESGVIDAATLEKYLQRQLESIIYDIFTWPSGYYSFNSAESDREHLTLQITPAQVILQGVQKTYTAEMLERYFSETETVLVLTSDPRYRFQSFIKGHDEEKIITLLDGSRTVNEIILELGLPSRDVRKFLYGLLLSRVVRKKGESENLEKEDLFVDEENEIHIDEDLRKMILQKYIQVQTRDSFEIMEVSQSASPKEMKSAFLKMAKTYHPDRYFNRLDDKYNDYVKAIFQKINQVFQEHAQGAPPKEDSSSPAAHPPESQSPDDHIARAEHFFEKGMNLYHQGKYRDAQNELISAIQVNPKEPEYHLQLGLIFLENQEGSDQNLDLAESAFNHAMTLSRGDARPFFYQGCVYKVRNDHDRSEQMFEQALERNPKYIEALREMRLIHSRKKKSVKQIFQGMIGIH